MKLDLRYFTEAGLPRRRRYTGRGPIALSEKGRKQRHLAQLAYIEKRVKETKPPGDFHEIPGFDGRYSIHRDGRVFGHYKRSILSSLVNSGGYTTVTLNHFASHRPWELHVLLMLTFVGPCPDGHEVDHENRIKSDNRLSNLRYVTQSVNGHNAMKPKRRNHTVFRGVAFHERNINNPWHAKIRGGALLVDGGYFATDIEAARSYDRMASRIYGPTAITNKSLGLL